MVFVKSLDGKTRYTQVDLESTVGETVKPFTHMESVTVEHGGRPLQMEQKLNETGVSALSQLNISGRLSGGHCQVPCGIFDDPKFVAELRENAATIRKAMVQIGELHAKGGSALDFNQMVRWVNVKEQHCEKIISGIAEYALCQRVKTKGVFASEKDYIDALKAHHATMQAAMKAKQSVDLAFADALEHAIEDTCKMYLK